MKWIVCLILMTLTGLQTAAQERAMVGTKPVSYASNFTVTDALPDSNLTQEELRNSWGLDILISNDGFGFGAFYKREFSRTLSGFVSFSISESKDEKEVERYDPIYGTSFTPGKLNRFLVMPLIFGVQHRLFEDEITETFRPYVNAGVGPTMIFVAPYVEVIPNGATPDIRQVEFFNSLGKGQPHYTIASYIGVGANFGSEKSNVFGVNFRYYFTYLFSNGLPSLGGLARDNTLQVTSRKKDFGGFFITINVGLAY